MPTHHTAAIVLRAVEFSETSLVVTLLTRDLGRVSAIAKGARRLKGPFEGALDLLAVCRVVVITKNSDSLDLLTEAKLQRRFRGGQRSLPRLYGGYYIAEMLRLLTDDHDPHSDVYDLTIETLRQIDGDGDVTGSLLYFDAQALRMLGHAPQTERCTDCGGELSSAPRVAFSIAGGGVVCPDCRGRQRHVISVGRNTIDWLERLQSSETKLPAPMVPACYGELRAVMNRYLQSVVGCMPRTQHLVPTALGVSA